MAKQHRATQEEWQVIFESARKGYIYCSATAELADRVDKLEKLSAIHSARMLKIGELEHKVKALERTVDRLKKESISRQMRERGASAGERLVHHLAYPEIDPEEARNLGFIPADDAREELRREAKRAAGDAFERLSARATGILGGVKQEVLQRLLAEMPAGSRLTWMEPAENPLGALPGTVGYVPLVERVGDAIADAYDTCGDWDNESSAAILAVLEWFRNMNIGAYMPAILALREELER